jgi:hypothetical protein
MSRIVRNIWGELRGTRAGERMSVLWGIVLGGTC